MPRKSQTSPIAFLYEIFDSLENFATFKNRSVGPLFLKRTPQRRETKSKL